MTNKQIKEFLDKKSGVDIGSKSREDIYIRHRCIYYYLAFKYSDEYVTNANVSKEVNRNHATVLSGFKVFRNLYSTDKLFRCLTDGLEKEVSSLTGVKIKRAFNHIDESKDYVLRRKVKNLTVKNMQLNKRLKKLTNIEVN